jgi:hypothetical protein
MNRRTMDVLTPTTRVVCDDFSIDRTRSFVKVTLVE